MLGQFKLSLSSHWSRVVLLLLMYFATGDAVLCNSCSYTYTGTYYGYECVNDTEKVKTANVVSCPNQYCQAIVVYKRHERNEFVVSSLARACSLTATLPTGDNCTESATERTCTYVCKGEKCNNQDLVYKKPPNNGTTSCFICRTIVFMVATILLLQLFF